MRSAGAVTETKRHSGYAIESSWYSELSTQRVPSFVTCEQGCSKNKACSLIAYNSSSQECSHGSLNQTMLDDWTGEKRVVIAVRGGMGDTLLL